MTAPARSLVTVDEFLASADEREGRWELDDGVLFAMAPERLAHAEAKAAAWSSLNSAIARSRAPCRAVVDGCAVRITSKTAYQPDALVYCGPRLASETREIPNPVIVVEVLSDSTAKRDVGRKLLGYFSLASVAHYLIIDPEERVLFHHARGVDGAIEAKVLREGPLRLDPPGLDLSVADLFPEL